MCFIQMVDKPELNDLIYTLKPRAKLSRRQDPISILKEIGKGFTANVVNMLRDEHVNITRDG